jgi:RNA-directed DNA polymerase
MHGSMWRELETERGTCPRSLGWDSRPGNRRKSEGPRTYRQEKPPRQFPTLHTFRPRKSRSRATGKFFTSFAPAVSKDALKAMSGQVRSWRLHARTTWTLDGLAEAINPIVRGWINYYGRFRRYELYLLLMRINAYLVRWARKKYRRLRSYRRAKAWWQGLVQRAPELFAQWACTTAFWGRTR